jgi:hypothetical protein
MSAVPAVKPVLAPQAAGATDALLGCLEAVTRCRGKRCSPGCRSRRAR